MQVHKTRASRKKKPKKQPPAPHLKVTRSDFRRYVSSFLDLLGTERAYLVKDLFNKGFSDKTKHLELLNLSCEPASYSDPHQFALDWQATRLFSKYTDLNTGLDKQQAALETVIRSEARCKLTNERIKSYRSGHVNALGMNETILSKVQALISEVLYEAQRLQFLEDVGFSSGRTTSAYGDTLDPVSKYGSRLDTTVNALPWAFALVKDCPNWSASILEADGPCCVLKSAFNIVEGNVMFTVPKNAKTDRVICYEPHMNIRIQKAFGNMIRRALRKKGVNLDDQSINQRRAKLGSKTGHLATLDLRSASDTISRELIFLLLPIDWALLLDDIRSKRTLWPDGQWRINEKFSSMGNGFTFELESLIFWAVAQAASGCNVSVYGDDMIIPSECYDTCVEALVALGFEVNEEKSFSDGPFRESCGCDCFNGFEVTPFRVSEKVSSRKRLVLLHNQIRKWAKVHLPTVEVEGLLRLIRDEHAYPFGPDMTHVSGDLWADLAQGHYHVNWDVATPQRSRSSETWQGWHYRQWQPGKEVIESDFSMSRGYAALCASLGPKAVRSVYDTTRSVEKWSKSRSWASHWPNVMWI